MLWSVALGKREEWNKGHLGSGNGPTAWHGGGRADLSLCHPGIWAREKTAALGMRSDPKSSVPKKYNTMFFQLGLRDVDEGE